MGRSRYDFITGLLTEGEDTQKLYYSFELKRRLQKAGFKGIQFGKVLYPWNDTESDESLQSISGAPTHCRKLKESAETKTLGLPTLAISAQIDEASAT